MRPKPRTLPTLEQARAFWSRTVRDGACLRWTGTFAGNSGWFVCGALQMSAARFAYLVHHGDPGPRKLWRSCGHSWCVDPDHICASAAVDPRRARGTRRRLVDPRRGDPLRTRHA